VLDRIEFFISSLRKSLFWYCYLIILEKLTIFKPFSMWSSKRRTRWWWWWWWNWRFWAIANQI